MRLNQEKKLKSNPVFTYVKLSIKFVYTFLTRRAIFTRLLVFILIFSWIFSGWPRIWQNPPFPPEIEAAKAATRTIEQQINITDQLYSNASATYNPTDNSFGLIRWDSAKYNGDTVYFEAVIQGNNPVADCIQANAALFSSNGTEVTGSAVSKNNAGYARIRSAALTLGTLPNLESGIDYTVRIKCTASGIGNASIKAARFIIVQSDATSITDTQTQVEVGNNQSTTGTTYADLTDKKIYRYTSANWTPTPTVNFEASLKAPSTEGTPTDTGPNNPATGAQDTTIGTIAWGSYTNSFSDNATYDAVSLGKNVISYYNKATNFSFSGIPSDATIKGIKVEINGYVENTFMDDYSVKIVKGGTITGNELASATDWPTSDAGAYRTYGGTTDLWGAAWSPSDINSNTGFGVAFSFKNNKTGAGATYIRNIYHIRITVTYAPAVAQTAYAALCTTGGTLVTGSEVSTTSTSWTRVRTASPITLSDATDYVARVKTSTGGTASIANAKIVLDQTAAGGIDKLETLQQYVNTLATDADATYTLQNFNNEFNPANWVGGTFNDYFEATMKTTTGTGYAQLYNVSAADAIDTATNSEINTVSTAYERQISADLSGNTDWPSVARDLDTQIKNSATNTTSVSSSRLVIKVSGLASIVLSTAIEVRAQNYTTSVSSITFPVGASGATVSAPYNNVDTITAPQVFGGAGTAKPVVTLYNGNASTLTVWYNVTTFTNSVVSSESYLVNAKGAACADASCITQSATFGADTTTGTTITAGAGNEKDFYLKITLGTPAGKSGDSTLTILGEVP